MVATLFSQFCKVFTGMALAAMLCLSCLDALQRQINVEAYKA